jgi:hypothetical protein
VLCLDAIYLVDLVYIMSVSRDGNEDLIPDSPRGIPLLGDGYGTSPRGSKWRKFNPRRVRGDGDGRTGNHPLKALLWVLVFG